MSEPAFRRLPRAVREQQMLDAAVAMFSRRGYHAASVDDIAEAAGISKPMVYAYVGTKEELFVACIHREGTRLIEAIAAASAADTGAEELSVDQRLWRGLRAFFGFVASHQDGWTVLYRQARGQEPFADVLAHMRARMVEIVISMLAGSERGGSACQADVAVLAYAFVGAAEALADWIVERSDRDADALATDLMSAVWLGAGALLAGAEWRPQDRGDHGSGDVTLPRS